MNAAKRRTVHPQRILCRPTMNDPAPSMYNLRAACKLRGQPVCFSHMWLLAIFTKLTADNASVTQLLAAPATVITALLLNCPKKTGLAAIRTTKPATKGSSTALKTWARTISAAALMWKSAVQKESPVPKKITANQTKDDFRPCSLPCQSKTSAIVSCAASGAVIAEDRPAPKQPTKNIFVPAEPRLCSSEDAIWAMVVGTSAASWKA
mmetsp:Transcript_29169/g.80054  ORF Transcript_29169/g.80054 Transcript_29169/m.80054 type:complete len:208 (+) Transcript_29169:167-790(+)